MPTPTDPVDSPASQPQVKHLRQVLLWPLRLMPLPTGVTARPWELLTPTWTEVVDEYTGHAAYFHERHYNEFVTFLPYVQRFLYGEGRVQRHAGADGSPMRVFRRCDIAQVRVQPRPGEAHLMLNIVHVDLYFFLGIDLVLLNLAVSASDLPWAQAQDLLYRFGRSHPAGWDAQGLALHCMASGEFLGASGQVLAHSDAQQRDAFLAHVSEHRAPRIAAHWAFMLEPLVSDHSDRVGALRLRQIEYYRMPTMAYLAVDNPRALSRNDFVRLGLMTAAAKRRADRDGARDSALPFAEPHLADFEQRYCHDRFWADTGDAPNTRYLCSGHSLVVAGDARSHFCNCAERGVLAQFRHQHFLLFLIAHFQKAALLTYSDRLADALTHLDIGDADSLRRQANTDVRLMVVTIFGLIGTVTTGFLGMNLLAEAEAPMSRRVLLFSAGLIATTVLTVYTIAKSKRLADFLDALSDERLSAWTKFKTFAGVWRRDDGG